MTRSPLTTPDGSASLLRMGTDWLLIVDDEADIHAVTKLSLKGLKQPGRKLEILSASSGREAVEALRKNPNIGVVLLDVVMEKDDAGLVACRAIREELGNHLVRIILRTGQPGAAPERQTIDEYDIDGYLPKSDLTAGKLYSTVRTALRAHGDLVELDRHRRVLTAINECAISLRSFAPLTETLQRILDTALAIGAAPQALLQLETFDRQGEVRRYFLSAGAADIDAEDLRGRIVREGAAGGLREPGAVAGGFLVPLEVHRELGHGWLFVAVESPEPIVKSALPILAAHAANALYSSLAESILRAEQAPIFDTMTV